MSTVVTLDQGYGDADDEEFWSYLGGQGEIAPAEPDEAVIEEFTPLLYRVDGDPNKPLQKVGEGTPHTKHDKDKACLDKALLDFTDVFLLDDGWEIFIWIGGGADTSEKMAAMGAADRYALIEPRANFVPVTIVKAQKETPKFLAYFKD